VTPQAVRSSVRSWFYALTLALAVHTTAEAAGQAPSIRLPSSRDSLYILQFDVGQGDATLISTAGKRVLIDAGTPGALIAQRLREIGIDTIDLVISSHNHQDHIGGIPDVLASLAIRAYMDNGVPATTQVYRRIIATVEAQTHIRYLEASSRTISLGEATLRVLPPPRFNDQQNDNSVGIVVEFGLFRALYTGDSEEKELSYWVSQRLIPQVTVLKGAHHGSSDGITREWIDATKPRIVLLSAGASNSYGHPDMRVIQAWQSIGARVYRTDVDGGIVIVASKDGTHRVATTNSVRP